jgi:hypothetical protein
MYAVVLTVLVVVDLFKPSLKLPIWPMSTIDNSVILGKHNSTIARILCMRLGALAATLSTLQ